MIYSHNGIKVTADSKEEAIDIFKKSDALTNKIVKVMDELSMTESAHIDADYKSQGKVAKFIREFSTVKKDTNATLSIRFEGSVELDDEKTIVDIYVQINKETIARILLGGKQLSDKSFKDEIGKIFAFVIAFENL